MSKAYQELADLVSKSNISPTDRREAIERTLREISSIVDGVDNFSLQDLGAAYVIVSKRRAEDTPATSLRRANCAQLCELVDGRDRGDARKAAPSFLLVSQTMGGNTRAEFIAANARREYDEIRQFCRMPD